MSKRRKEVKLQRTKIEDSPPLVEANPDYKGCEKILIVDDDKLIRTIFRDLLEPYGYRIIEALNSKDALKVVVESQPDIILLDIIMPGMDGIELCLILKNREDTSEIPIIMISSRGDEKIIVKAIKIGADDYLVKPIKEIELLARIHTQLRNRRQYLETAMELEKRVEERTAKLNKEIEERKRVEEALASEKERLAVTLRSIGDGVITTDINGSIVLINKVAEKLTGWTQKEAFGKPFAEVFRIINKKTRELCDNPVEKVLKTDEKVGLSKHTALVSRDGKERLISSTGAPIHDKDSKIIGVVSVFRDITNFKKMEEDLLKARSLESIGILAGGIAHDFNNLLTGVLGNISLAKMLANPEEKVFKRLVQAEKASMQAQNLTQQLLTFSRGGDPVKKTASISELLSDSSGFALRGSNVRCDLSISDDLWPAEIDEGQISQVINNLVINADQAMPDGGKVTIKTENTTIEAQELPPLKKGKYVKISIEDEGVGIPEEHLQKIFDPYFTTKQKGSGLGLATCHSIIKNHDGCIIVESEIGVGTTFNIYLPASEKEITRKERIAKKTVSGNERVLVMDDEENIREFAEEMLTYLGYKPEFAKDGEETISLYKEAKKAGKPFDAVIMDLTIPGGMGGKEAIVKLLEIDPDVNAIVSSGYSNDPVMANFRKYGFSGVITKPYTIEDLSSVVDKVIN